MLLGRLLERGIGLGVGLGGKRIGHGPGDEGEGWLDGPLGGTQIGRGIFDEVARARALVVHHDREGSGLLPSFEQLRSSRFDPDETDARVRNFYECTTSYGMEVWSQWRGVLRVLPRLVIKLVSPGIQQFNVPLDPLDTSRGMTSEILEFAPARGGGEIPFVGWLRHSNLAGQVVYAGFYSTCEIPNADGPHVRVVFPLPKGNSTAILRPVNRPDGSFELVSDGKRFGDCGAYRVHKRRDGGLRAVLTPIKERIHVYVDDAGTLRTDHSFAMWNVQFLTLHYRMHRRDSGSERPPSPTLRSVARP